MIKQQTKIERIGNFIADFIQKRRIVNDRPPLTVITQRQETRQDDLQSANDDLIEEICHTMTGGHRGRFISSGKQDKDRSLNLLYTKSAPVHKIRPLQRGDL